MTKYEKKQIIRAAKDLLYSKEVIHKIEAATSMTECSRIMRTARNNSK